MKTTAKYLAMFTLAASTTFISCISNKKKQVSEVRIEQLRKDSIATHQELLEAHQKLLETHQKLVETDQKLTETNHKLHDKHAHIEKRKVHSESHSSSNAISSDNSNPLPPQEVLAVFRTNFPYANNVSWTKEKHCIKVHNHDVKGYRAHFYLQHQRNTIVYSENGEVVEIRTEILPEQLPQNIYVAIKKKYPDMFIVSASTYKNIKTNGSYTALIRTKSDAEDKEVILTDSGKFAE